MRSDGTPEAFGPRQEVFQQFTRRAAPPAPAPQPAAQAAGTATGKATAPTVTSKVVSLSVPPDHGNKS
jgi:hypothetical protein